MTFEFRRFKLHIGFSFFAVLGLMLLLSDGTITLLCFVSSLLHECGHLVFLLLFSADIRAVSFGAGGIVIERSNAFCGAVPECFIALGGVMVNALLCFSAFLCYRKTNLQNAAVFCLVNGVLAGLNLLPVRSLDSYRVMDILLRRRLAEGAELTLTRISFASLVLFIVLCAAFYLSGVRNISLAAVCVYLMLLHWKRS